MRQVRYEWFSFDGLRKSDEGVDTDLASGLSPAGAEGRCAPKKMAENEVPPQSYPISPLHHIQ